MDLEHPSDATVDGVITEFDAPAVVRDGSRQIGLAHATLTLDDGELTVGIEDDRFVLPIDGLSDVGFTDPPDAIADRFEKAVRVSGHTASGDRCLVLAVGDGDDMAGFAWGIMAARLEGEPVLVEQTIVPTKVDGSDPATHTVEATLDLDAAAGSIAFDDADLEPIHIPSVTGIEQVDTEIRDETRSAVKVRHLPLDRRVTTLVSSLDGSTTLDLFLSHLVNASRADGRSGPIRVLFVDDEPGLVSIAAEFLERAYRDMDVETATSVATAVTTLDDETVECVVSDYAMDDGDGMDLLDAMREREVDLPFILFTRKSEEEVGTLPTDVTAYFQKEMGTDQYQKLAKLIERVVSDRRTR